MRIDVQPLTPKRWKDLVELFGRPGGSVVRGCWCMYYRKTGTQFASAHARAIEATHGRAEANKQAMKALVEGGTVPGLIGYRAGRPIAWISLGPREDYLRLARSPVMKPVDDKPVWSLVCFFVDVKERGTGVAEAMLKAAIDYARSQGATLLEAYPVDKSGRSFSDWFGVKRMYDRAGFTEVARRKPTRPVMRRALRPRVARKG